MQDIEIIPQVRVIELPATETIEVVSTRTPLWAWIVMIAELLIVLAFAIAVVFANHGL